MTREMILSIFADEYKRNFSESSDIQLQSRLVLTSQSVCRSFEYDLPKQKGMKARGIRFVKRLIRKSIRFITTPYAEKNLKFQENMCDLTGLLIKRLQTLSSTVNEQNLRIAELEAQLSKIGGKRLV